MSVKSALEKMVVEALCYRGMTPSEAEVTVKKLQEIASFKGDAEVEMSDCGKYLAISNVSCTYRSQPGGGKQGAILVQISGKEYWIPYLQVASMSEVIAPGERGTLVVKRWIAENKGWIKHGVAIPINQWP